MEKKRSYKSAKTAAPIVIAPNEYGKMPPQAVELEEAVLGALMIEKDAYSYVSEILRPESFYKEAHQKIFRAVVDLASKQQPIDMLTVPEQLKRNGELDEIGGAYYIAQLTAKVASAAHIEYHSRILAQKFLARELIRISAEIQKQAYEEQTDVDDLMQEAEGMIFEVGQRNLKRDFTPINPVIDDAIKHIQAAASRPEGLSGTPSGFTELDKISSGWQPSTLVIIAARPAMGKTAFVLSMAKNMAVDYQTPIAVFSLEMSNRELVNRLIMNVCEIEGEKIKNGRLEDYEWTKLDQNVKKLYDAPIYVDDTPSLSVFELRTKARRLKSEYNIGCIIIDYLQLMNASGMNFGSREQEVSIISRSLKGLAKELDIPIIALSQLNRGVEGRSGIEGKRPQLSDLRESGAIEQDADMVCFIHRPEYYKITEDSQGNSLLGIAEIIVAKHRSGATGDVSLRFVGKYAKFQNLNNDYFSSNNSGYVELRSGGSANKSIDVGQQYYQETAPNDPFGSGDGGAPF